MYSKQQAAETLQRDGKPARPISHSALDVWGFTKKPKQSERGRHRLLTEQLADTRAGGVRRSKQTKSNKRELTGSAHGE
ncbi:hypothetical protein ATANTOWER_000731 [Ataeniobius toweri]|uniref:Uncharacterized protein n=1 Tax=Ataeniobius toweri TaxID=208326 RepID=A0ABU7C6Q1_9TELE|nr:hypothetical protein [Ataeniobius toweri]